MIFILCKISIETPASLSLKARILSAQLKNSLLKSGREHESKGGRAGTENSYLTGQVVWIHNPTGYLSGSVRGELGVTVTCLYLFVLIHSGTDGLKRCPVRPPCDAFNFRLNGLLLSK